MACKEYEEQTVSSRWGSSVINEEYERDGYVAYLTHRERKYGLIELHHVSVCQSTPYGVLVGNHSDILRESYSFVSSCHFPFSL